MKKGGKILTISEQLREIKFSYPKFNSRFRINEIIIEGDARPTPRSLNYSFKLEYSIKGGPRVYILSPPLIRNGKNEKIPHMYEQKRLCLYFPKYQEFTSRKYLAETIIPWISLWLYYYETWHQTGKWLGGGIHPTKSKRPNL